MIVPSITNMYFTEIVEAIEKYIRKEGYDIFLNITSAISEIERDVVNKALDRYVDGIIVIDPQTENLKSGFYNEVIKSVPVVFINGYHEDIDLSFVITNEGKGFLEALEFLNRKGHRNIIFVRGENSYSYDIKEEMYREFIKNIGGRELIVSVNEGNSIDVVENTKNSIIDLSQSVKLGVDYTAFISCNDLMAVGILNACNEMGVEVPDEVSVIGFDNIILSQMTSPKLSTVDQNMKQLGKKAAELILGYIEDGYVVEKIEIGTKLIIRESC